jgi:hypothetical protein
MLRAGAFQAIGIPGFSLRLAVAATLLIALAAPLVAFSRCCLDGCGVTDRGH